MENASGQKNGAHVHEASQANPGLDILKDIVESFGFRKDALGHLGMDQIQTESRVASPPPNLESGMCWRRSILDGMEC